MAYVIFNLLCVAVLIGIDQGIKFWAVHVLMPVGTLPLIPHVVELRFVLNQGMAFSLLSGKQLFLIVATSAALLLVAYWLFFRSRNNRLQQAALHPPLRLPRLLALISTRSIRFSLVIIAKKTAMMFFPTSNGVSTVNLPVLMRATLFLRLFWMTSLLLPVALTQKSWLLSQRMPI